MRQSHRRLTAALVGLAIAAVVTPAPARADFMLSLAITETGPTGSATLDIPDNASPFDTNPGVGSINAPTADLNGFLSEFQFVGPLTVTINGGSSGSDTTAVLSLNGDLTRTSAAGQAMLSLDAVATGVPFPAGNPKTLTGSGDDTFIAGGESPSRTFQGFFNDQGTGLATLSPPPFNQLVKSKDLGNAPVPYTLRYVTTIAMGPASGVGPLPEDRFSGAATVTAVPEPPALTSLVIAALLVASFWGGRRVASGSGRIRPRATLL